MTMALDILIIILIAIMITYSVLLNIKLKAFRNTQNEMASLIGQLNAAITRAQSSVEALKNAAVTEETRLEELIKNARLMADELEIITQSGSNLADRIERGLIPDQATNTGQDNDEAGGFQDETVEADNEMLEALKKVR